MVICNGEMVGEDEEEGMVEEGEAGLYALEEEY